MTDWNRKTCRDNERFTIPKASLTFSRIGSPVYGLRDRTTVRPLAHQFEREKAQKNQESFIQQSRPPSGRRHEAKHLYFNQIQQIQEKQELENKNQKLNMQHWKIYGTSKDNPLIDLDQEVEEEDFTDENNNQISNVAMQQLTSLNMIPYGQGKRTKNYRYQARDNYWSQKLKKQIKELQQSQDDKQENQEESEAMKNFKAAKLKESYLIKNYPHGLPKILLKEMRDQGLELPSLGYGLSSMLPESAQMFLRI